MASKKALNLALLRTFSTSAQQNQLVKAPVQVFGLEGRYASALYSAASKQKELDTVEKDLDNLKKVFATDKIFREFLLSPVVGRTLKEAAVKAASGKLSLSPSSTNFLALLAENGRFKNLSGIINLFKVLMAAHRGDLPIEVVTAQPLDDAMRQELEAALKKFAKKGEQALLSYKIDPSIIGGMVVSIGDRYVDLSTASKLKRYSDVLKETT